MTWFRALFAAGLSVLLPGAGHVLIRDWLRAFVFAGVYFSAVYFFFPIELLAEAGSTSEMLEIAASETGSMAQFALSFLALFAAIDATFRAVGYPPDADGTEAGSGDGPSCPECGKELDEDLEFCHWCTTRLEPAEPDDDQETLH